MANLSLRPLAASAGTSARMLLHYFGSKEALIGEVMEHVQARLRANFQELATRWPHGTAENLLHDFWKVVSGRSIRPALRLLFEVQMLALQNPKRYRRYLLRSSATWRNLIEEALPKRQRNAAASTLYTAVIDGLLLELLATGDLTRTTRAFVHFAGGCAPATRRRGTRRP